MSNITRILSDDSYYIPHTGHLPLVRGNWCLNYMIAYRNWEETGFSRSDSPIFPIYGPCFEEYAVQNYGLLLL
jgi:hypothetical protein